MKKSLLVGITGITIVALTATTLYAQTATGTSIIAKMKATVSAFTLAGDLNPGQTGLQSAPVSGKKTGDVLTAGEYNRLLEMIAQSGWSSSGTALYICTNAQSLDTANAPCYGASRNGGAGTNQYRVISCTDFDGTRSYTMSSILNFWQLVANKWAVSVNGGTIECDEGTVLVMDIQSGWSNSSATSNLTYINPDNTDFTPLECTPGMNYMINPISFSAESASTYTSKKVAVLKSGNWRLKGTSFDGVRNKNSDSSQTLRINSIVDGATTQLLNTTVDIGMYIYSLPATSTNYETVSVPAGKTAQIDVSLRNINLRGGQLMAWCTN